MTVNVFTVLWVGDGPYVYCTRPKGDPLPDSPEQRLYTPSEVIRFERVIRKHLPDCKFWCLSNVEIPGIATIPLGTSLKGWWPTIEVYRPDLPGGRCVYFDLDTLPIRDIDSIVNYPAPFAAIKPGGNVGSDKPAHPWEDHEGFWRHPGYQCSVKVFDRDYVAKFWDAFDPVEHPKTLASDQDFLGRYFPDEAKMPTKWFSLIHAMPHFPPEPVKVVLTIQMQNDKARQLYPWVRRVWPTA